MKNQHGAIVVVDGFSMGALLAEELAQSRACIHVLSNVRYLAKFRGGIIPAIYRSNHVFEASLLDDLVDKLKTEGIVAVTAGSEWGVELAELLAEKLDVPGNAPSTTSLRRDKFCMGMAASAAGLAVAKQVQVSSSKEAMDWMRATSFDRVVAKPMASAASDHVYICGSPEELGHAVSRILAASNVMLLKNERVLIQEYLDGIEYVVNTVSDQSLHRVSEVWKVHKHLTAEGRNIYDFDDLCELDDADALAAVAYVRDLLPILGVRFGAGHSEVMLTSRGVRLLETAARVSGAANPCAIRAATGDDQIGLLVKLLTNRDGFLHGKMDYTRQLHVRCVHLQVRRSRRFSHSRIQDFLSSLPTFSNIVFRAADGVIVAPTVDVATCPGAFFLVAADEPEIVRDYEAFREWELASDTTSTSLSMGMGYA